MTKIVKISEPISFQFRIYTSHKIYTKTKRFLSEREAEDQALSWCTSGAVEKIGSKTIVVTGLDVLGVEIVQKKKGEK